MYANDIFLTKPLSFHSTVNRLKDTAKDHHWEATKMLDAAEKSLFFMSKNKTCLDIAKKVDENLTNLLVGNIHQIMRLVLKNPEEIIPGATTRNNNQYSERFSIKVQEGGHYRLFKNKHILDKFIPLLTSLVEKFNNRNSKERYEIFSFLGIDLEKMLFNDQGSV
jgi:hypothetical protein